MDYYVVEKKNENAVHIKTWSLQRGYDWIEKYGDSAMFMNKSLNKGSFKVIQR